MWKRLGKRNERRERKEGGGWRTFPTLFSLSVCWNFLVYRWNINWGGGGGKIEGWGRSKKFFFWISEIILLKASSVEDAISEHSNFLSNCLKDAMLTQDELVRAVYNLLFLCWDFAAGEHVNFFLYFSKNFTIFFLFFFFFIFLSFFFRMTLKLLRKDLKIPWKICS